MAPVAECATTPPRRDDGAASVNHLRRRGRHRTTPAAKLGENALAKLAQRTHTHTSHGVKWQCKIRGCIAILTTTCWRLFHGAPHDRVLEQTPAHRSNTKVAVANPAQCRYAHEPVKDVQRKTNVRERTGRCEFCNEAH